MKRLTSRFALVALSLSLLTSSILFCRSLHHKTIVTLKTPLGSLSLQLDHDGWLWHYDTMPGNLNVDVREMNAGADSSWETNLADISPTWITSGVVAANWEQNNLQFLLLGFKHYVVISTLALATLTYALWFRRRWRNQSDTD